MKSIFTIASLAMLLGALVWGTTSAAAQEEASPREAILASIPTLSNFEEQADTTFVGDVEGSYAYIAFVVRDNFAVVYLCDNILSHWLSGEIVDGTAGSGGGGMARALLPPSSMTTSKAR